MDPQTFKSFIEKIVVKAGSLLLTYKSKSKVVKQKDIQDIATTADLASEKYLIDTILSKYPSHGIVSEEQGELNSDAEFKWIIDPLDGTKEFVRDVPQWNVSIALQQNKETICSAIFRPYENVLYSSCLGLGSFKNGKQIKVSNITKLTEAFVYCYIPSFKRNQDKYDWSFNKLKEIISGNPLFLTLGFVPTADLSAIYRLATLYCQPSLYEGFGLPLLEAMTAGCLVVSSNTGSLPEIYPTGTLTFDPTNQTEIERAIGKALAFSEKEREKLIKSGQEKAKQFSWTKTAQLTYEVYRENN